MTLSPCQQVFKENPPGADPTPSVQPCIHGTSSQPITAGPHRDGQLPCLVTSITNHLEIADNYLYTVHSHL